MKNKIKVISSLLIVMMVSSIGYLQINNTEKKLTSKEEYESYLANHPFKNGPKLNKKQLKAIPKKDRPDLAAQQNWIMTMNPVTKRPEPELLYPIYEMTKNMQSSVSRGTPGSTDSPWVERGPDNVGGRTRAIMYDPNDATGKKVWAGGVTGGLWYNNDITDSNSEWVAVDDFWDNIAITCMAYDPNDSQIFYVGTGEGFSAQSSKGAGVWKSTDGGSTWSRISSTSTYAFINDIAVRDESGTSVIYIANGQSYYEGNWAGVSGLYRSDNGGTWFAQVLPNATTGKHEPTRIEIGADNRLWVGTQDNAYGEGGGKIFYSDTGTSGTWTTAKTITNGGRVEIACAPSNANYVYAVYEVSGEVGGIIYTSNKGTSWTNVSEPNDADSGIPASDFTRGQVWYDLVIAVDPNNANTVFVGGIDLFKSTNNGSSWTQISHWYGGWSYPEVHADQHAITFKPGSSSEILFGNDGGVYRTTTGTSSSPSFQNKNAGYNVTQFYACAIHPTAGTNYYLAGAQDNGTQQYNSAGINSTIEATGGDGAFCFIDQTNPTYQITSYVYNSYYRSTNGGSWFSSIQDDNTGLFINPADYDDNLDILYSGYDSLSLNRIKNISGSYSIGTISVSLNADASHIRVSPYTTSSTTLFVGTEAGRVYKITNANTTPTATLIGMLPNGNISCIEIGANEDELLVTLSNYGLISVWYTNNGGSTWSNKEGNLPNMPVRWALFNPNDRNQVILATEVGVWNCDDISVSSPSWTSSSSGLANVRVDMLQIRESDKQVIAATHGRGLFSSDGFGCSITVSATNSNPTCGNSNGSISVTPSGGTPSYTYAWSNGATTASINSISAGQYTVTISDAGTCTTIETYTMTDPGTPTLTLNGNDPTCGNTNGSITASITGGGAITAYVWSNGATTQNISSLSGGSYNLTVTDEFGCTDNASVNLTDLGGVTVTLSSSDPTCLNNDGNINAIVSGGTTPYTYIWNEGSSTSGISNLSEGTYSIEILDNNLCSNQASVTLTISNPLVYNITSTPNTCGLSDGAIGVQVSGGNGGYTYLWSNSETTASISNINEGAYSVTITDGGGCSAITSETITAQGMISVTTSATHTSCGLNNGSASVSVTGGSIPYNYSWSNGATVNSINSLSSGTYYATVSDNNGCTSVETIVINNSSAPALSFNEINPSCNLDNGSIEAIITGGQTPYNYNWSNGATTNIILGLGQNSYQVTITDNFGCEDNGSTTITNSGIPAVAVITTTDALCTYSGDGSAVITVFGGAAPYDYIWPNGNTTDNPADLTSGTHIVTVNDANACGTTASVTISNLPEIMINVTTTTASCNANNGSATINASNAATPYTYLWDNAETTAMVNTLAQGNYTVSVYDGNNCYNTENIAITEINDLSVTITAVDVSCYGQANGQATAATSGGSAPYNYYWVFGNQTTATATGFPIGTYDVNVEDVNGCQTSQSVTISQPNSLSIVATTATDALCNEPVGSASVTVTGGTTPYDYQWNNGMTGATITGLTPYNLEVNVYDNNGCLTVGYETVNGIGDANVSTLSQNVKCNGASTGSVMTIASGLSNPYTYLWNNGNTTSAQSNIPAGLYDVTITDKYGCEYLENFTITEPTAITISGTVTDATSGNCDGQISTTVDGGTPGYTLSWSDGQNTETASNLCAGSYTLQVTDANNCIVNDSYIVNGGGVGINNLNVVDFYISPNPNSGVFDIYFNSVSNNITVTVVNYNGQTVFENKQEQLNETKINVDISNYAKGIYFVKVKHDNGMDIRKIIVN